MPEVTSETLLENRFQSIMIVGGYKTGKTYSLVTLMEHLDLHNPYGSKNLYLFDMDGDGAESLILPSRSVGTELGPSDLRMVVG